MKIHCLQTGTVRVKASQPHGHGPGPLRQLNLLWDTQWTQPLPIIAWAIETSEGIVLVDAGETARTAEPGYFPRWHPYYRLAVKFDVAAEQEIGPQLGALGIQPADVRTVILTHLHTDHAGGLHHFPHSEILVSAREHRMARGWPGRLRGYLPNRWPDWFAPRHIDFKPATFGTFSRTCRVTADGSVVIVDTPGHTPGHVSVIVQDDGVSYFLAGDATYDQQQLLDLQVDGVSPSKSAAVATMRAILDYARQNRTVYLPAHDPESAKRLDAASIIRVPPVGNG
jgi:N-acyl homoserine lactone hydrolase